METNIIHMRKNTEVAHDFAVQVLLERIPIPACIIDQTFAIGSMNEEFAKLCLLQSEKHWKTKNYGTVCIENFLKDQLTALIQNHDSIKIANPVITIASVSFTVDSLSIMASNCIIQDETTALLMLNSPHRVIPQTTTLIQNHEKNAKAIEYELQIAKKVQQGLFPRQFTNYTNLDIAGLFLASDFVSGDMYDVIALKNNKTVIFIFDVSGHGISSALIGVMAKMLFVQYCKNCERPSEIFHKVNEDICKYLKTGHYVTAFLGIINHSDNTMIYSQAGHVFPILYHKNNESVRFIKGNSIFLGHAALADIAVFHDDVITFDWNDKLLLYTDGLTEAINPNNQLYGNKRLLRLVKKYGHKSPDQLLQRIVFDNGRFRETESLTDDVTLLCVQFGCSEQIVEMSGFQESDQPQMLSFNSHDEIEETCSIIITKLEQKGYSSKDIFQAHQALYEVLDNAIQHGNKFNSDKKIIVLYTINLDHFCISVIDEGQGFNHTQWETEKSQKNISQSTGKGLILIKNYMDEVNFNEKGNRIMIKKYVNKESIYGNYA